MDDERPVIGKCVVCGNDIHDEDAGHYADKCYDFDGDLVCEDHVMAYVDERYKIRNG